MFFLQKFDIKEESNENDVTFDNGDNQRSFKCEKCSQCFIKSTGLKRHKCREKCKIIECHVCQKNFLTKRDLSAHLWTHRDKQPFVCKICSKVFVWKSDLKNHERSHQDERLYACDKCDKKFRTNYHLNTHKICHTNNKPFKCNICKRNFNRRNNLNTHMLTHMKDGKPYNCEICQQKFRRADRLSLHMQTHSKVKLLRCEYCKRAYENFNDLESHSLVHKEKKSSLICKICSQSFTKISDIILHDEKFHNKNNRKFKCTQCEEKFLKKVYLNNHMKKHFQILADRKKKYTTNSFECDICKNSYSTYRNIKRHIIIHMKCKYVYDCPICEKSFSCPREMNTHILTHVGGKPFVCDICKKSYLQKRYLMSHIRDVHEKIKKYSCNICHKNFLKIAQLQKHENCVHSLMKLYECNSCLKKFHAKSDLIVHVRRHFEIQPFECDNCEKKYKHKHSLLLHKMKHNSKKRRSENSQKGTKKLELETVINRRENEFSSSEICNNVKKGKCEKMLIVAIEPKNKVDTNLNLNSNNYLNIVVKEEFNNEIFETYDIEVEDVKIELEE